MYMQILEKIKKMEDLNWTVASVCVVPMYVYIFQFANNYPCDRSISSSVRLYKCVRVIRIVNTQFTTFLSWPVEGHVGISHSTNTI